MLIAGGTIHFAPNGSVQKTLAFFCKTHTPLWARVYPRHFWVDVSLAHTKLAPFNPLADLGNGGWKPHLCTPCHMSIRWPSLAAGGKTPPFSIIFCIKNGPFWTSGPLFGAPKGKKWVTPKSQLWPTMGGEWVDRWCLPVHNVMPLA